MATPISHDMRKLLHAYAQKIQPSLAEQLQIREAIERHFLESARHPTTGNIEYHLSSYGWRVYQRGWY